MIEQPTRSWREEEQLEIGDQLDNQATEGCIDSDSSRKLIDRHNFTSKPPSDRQELATIDHRSADADTSELNRITNSTRRSRRRRSSLLQLPTIIGPITSLATQPSLQPLIVPHLLLAATTTLGAGGALALSSGPRHLSASSPEARACVTATYLCVLIVNNTLVDCKLLEMLCNNITERGDHSSREGRHYYSKVGEQKWSKNLLYQQDLNQERSLSEFSDQPLENKTETGWGQRNELLAYLGQLGLVGVAAGPNTPPSLAGGTVTASTSHGHVREPDEGGGDKLSLPLAYAPTDYGSSISQIVTRSAPEYDEVPQPQELPTNRQFHVQSRPDGEENDDELPELKASRSVDGPHQPARSHLRPLRQRLELNGENLINSSTWSAQTDPLWFQQASIQQQVSQQQQQQPISMATSLAGISSTTQATTINQTPRPPSDSLVSWMGRPFRGWGSYGFWSSASSTASPPPSAALSTESTVLKSSQMSTGSEMGPKQMEPQYHGIPQHQVVLVEPEVASEAAQTFDLSQGQQTRFVPVAVGHLDDPYQMSVSSSGQRQPQLVYPRQEAECRCADTLAERGECHRMECSPVIVSARPGPQKLTAATTSPAGLLLDLASTQSMVSPTATVVSSSPLAGGHQLISAGSGPSSPPTPPLSLNPSSSSSTITTSSTTLSPSAKMNPLDISFLLFTRANRNQPTQKGGSLSLSLTSGSSSSASLASSSSSQSSLSSSGVMMTGSGNGLINGVSTNNGPSNGGQIVGATGSGYTSDGDNLRGGELLELNNETSSLCDSQLNRTLPIKIIIHGFGSGARRPWVSDMVNKLLELEDANVIVVDWERGAALPNYVQAAGNARLVGHKLAALIKAINLRYGLDGSRYHLIGFSLGAHVAGFAGMEIRNSTPNLASYWINRITGLDPASPLFEGYEPADRLDPSDAHFVDVIHSNGDGVLRGGFGSLQPMGHVDFYPNGGRVQVGCNSILLAALSDIIYGRWQSLCNHRRALNFFMDSFDSKHCRFRSFNCDSYDSYLRGDCFDCGPNKERCSNMGYLANGSHGRGKMYLTTHENAPFCANQFIIKIQGTKGWRSHWGKVEVTLVSSDGRNDSFWLSSSSSSSSGSNANSQQPNVHNGGPVSSPISGSSGSLSTSTISPTSTSTLPTSGSSLTQPSISTSSAGLSSSLDASGQLYHLQYHNNKNHHLLQAPSSSSIPSLSSASPSAGSNPSLSASASFPSSSSSPPPSSTGGRDSAMQHNMQSLIVAHSSLDNFTHVLLRYTKYKGWIYSGDESWSIDKVLIMDADGHTRSFCGFNTILESHITSRIRLGSGNCTVVEQNLARPVLNPISNSAGTVSENDPEDSSEPDEVDDSQSESGEIADQMVIIPTTSARGANNNQIDPQAVPFQSNEVRQSQKSQQQQHQKHNKPSALQQDRRQLVVNNGAASRKPKVLLARTEPTQVNQAQHQQQMQVQHLLSLFSSQPAQVAVGGPFQSLYPAHRLASFSHHMLHQQRLLNNHQQIESQKLIQQPNRGDLVVHRNIYDHRLYQQQQQLQQPPQQQPQQPTQLHQHNLVRLQQPMMVMAAF